MRFFDKSDAAAIDATTKKGGDSSRRNSRNLNEVNRKLQHLKLRFNRSLSKNPAIRSGGDSTTSTSNKRYSSSSAELKGRWLKHLSKRSSSGGSSPIYFSAHPRDGGDLDDEDMSSAPFSRFASSNVAIRGSKSGGKYESAFDSKQLRRKPLFPSNATHRQKDKPMIASSTRMMTPRSSSPPTYSQEEEEELSRTRRSRNVVIEQTTPIKRVIAEEPHLTDWLESRVRIVEQLPEVIDELNGYDVWKTCLSGKNCLSFKNKLDSVAEIARGTFGTVYEATIDDLKFVIKECAMSKRDVGRMRRNPNHIPRECGWYETFSLIAQLSKNPHFPLTYGTSSCESCVTVGHLGKNGSGRAPKSCFTTYLELADGTLDDYYHRMSDEADLKSVFLQLLVALHTMHSRVGFVHSDLKLNNVLYKRVKPGGYVKYDVEGARGTTDSYLIENRGIIILISDFGSGYAVKPDYKYQYGYSAARIGSFEDDYGLRSAEVMIAEGGERYWNPFRISFDAAENVPPADALKLATTPLPWRTNKKGCRNLMFADFFASPYHPTFDTSDGKFDPNDLLRFPAFDFFADIQDVVRCFTGGKRMVLDHLFHRTVLPTASKAIANGFWRTLYDRCYMSKMKYDVRGTVKYVVAAEMLRDVYPLLMPATKIAPEVIVQFTIK